MSNGVYHGSKRFIVFALILCFIVEDKNARLAKYNPVEGILTSYQSSEDDGTEEVGIYSYEYKGVQYTYALPIAKDSSSMLSTKITIYVDDEGEFVGVSVSPLIETLCMIFCAIGLCFFLFGFMVGVMDKVHFGDGNKV